MICAKCGKEINYIKFKVDDQYYCYDCNKAMTRPVNTAPQHRKYSEKMRKAQVLRLYREKVRPAQIALKCGLSMVEVYEILTQYHKENGEDETF